MTCGFVAQSRASHKSQVEMCKSEAMTDDEQRATVLPAKSGSDVMFCLQSYQGLRIDRSLVHLSYPQDKIYTQVIYRCALAQVRGVYKVMYY